MFSPNAFQILQSTNMLKGAVDVQMNFVTFLSSELKISKGPTLLGLPKKDIWFISFVLWKNFGDKFGLNEIWIVLSFLNGFSSSPQWWELNKIKLKHLKTCRLNLSDLRRLFYLAVSSKGMTFVSFGHYGKTRQTIFYAARQDIRNQKVFDQ